MTHYCQDAASALLKAIEQRDLHAMEQHVNALRGCVRPFEADERLDALAGVAEEIGRSLGRMRSSAAGEMARIRAAAPLLEHLTVGESPPLAQQH